MPSEILERTFVIPVTVTSSDHTKLSSSYSLLPLLKDLISSHEDQNLSSTLEFCLGCTTPVPMINRLCPFHGESQLLLSLSRRNIKPEGCSSSSTLLSSTFLTHESFKSEFVKIEELLCSKRLSSTGHCNSPFLIFDDYVLYIAGLNANSQYGPLRITQYSLKSILTTLPTTTTPTPNEGVNIPPVYTITYQITGTKYCHRIGRHHKSNHIMFEANINQGYIIQKCWDPDCRGYKSPPFYLPYNSLPSMYEIQEIITDIIITNSLELIN